MEIKARYVQVGAFTLAVLFAGFAFVYWLNNAGSLSDRAVYRVQFEGSVSGLLRGSAVLFNGIRVGEVTALELDPSDPRHVHASIVVGRNTPVRVDTTVSIEFQGLTGSPVISLSGGKSNQLPKSSKGTAALLIADVAASQSMSQVARDTLRRLDAIMADNAQSLRSVIGNFDVFSGALARNSGRVDGIIAGLERMTGGAASKARTVSYDLTVPRSPEKSEKVSSVQLIVPDPTALAALDNERIQGVTNGAYVNLADVQWSDTLPRLLQVKIVRGLEDTGRFAGVSRPLEGAASDFQLILDIRQFQIALNKTADLELGCKILGANGRFIAARLFRASVATEAPGAPAAVAAFDKAFGQAGAEIISWTAQIANDPPPARNLPKRTTGG